MPSDTLLKTTRLSLRVPDKSDASALLSLFNQPDFIDNIRDKNIRTIADAEAEIENVIHEHYQAHGFCLYAMDYADTACVGLCGLIKRPELAYPDIGFATRTEFQNLGLTTEACIAIVSHATEQLGLLKLAAIANPDNMASITVLNKAGFGFVDGMQLEEDGPILKYFELSLTNHKT